MDSKRIVKRSAAALAGSGILAFGLYHIHAHAGITEGGQLGLVLLLQHWFHISPALSGLVINAACYLFGWKALGRSFLYYSALSAAGFSLTYWICQQVPPLFTQLAQVPLIAAILGAVFVGLDCGLCVRVGGAPSGDDALALTMSRLYNIKIEYVYMLSDVTVLLLSLTYIPARRIIFSLLTVLLSSKLVGLVQRVPIGKHPAQTDKTPHE